MLNKQKNLKNAFTLTEVLVATLISGLILWYIFVFLWDMSTGIVETKKEVIAMSRIYELSHTINNYRNIYTTWSILVNNTWTWSDVFLMKDNEWKNGVLLWVVNIWDNKLDTDNTRYDDRWIWFRKLSEFELWEISTNTWVIYDYVFQEDQIFSDLKTQDLVFLSYNSWTIYDMSLIYNLDFQANLIWQYWADLPKDSLKKLNIDF